MNRPGNGCSLTFVRAVAVACGLLLIAGAARADKLRIENVTVPPRDAKTATIRFDIAWENSWRDQTNHDAAWVFFKARAEGGAEWQHVRLAADKVLNPTAYGQAEGGTRLDFIVPDGDDGFTGLFVRQAAEGKGAVAARGVTAIWDLTASKDITKDTKVKVLAFGVEMVYVAEGPFCLGSGGTEVGGFYQYTDGSQHTQPYKVTSAGAIPTGRQSGRLWARKYALPDDGGEIPASFPNGYGAFYCMKRYITWEQYAGFLNTVSAAQAAARCPEERQRIGRSGGPPNTTYSGAPSAARGLSWADGAAWAAWAALRPMTELEWEKAIRGPREPKPDEVGPSYWNIPFGHWFWVPLHDRDGERAVTVGNAQGRRFKGTHGRGTPVLPADWPQD
ncbi:MAG TPA: SUMF1/EgtB/PvdO family nonheme iron enzyme, partial [Phycisphaerae bacterium]|nr:SUMF1/EgtB/PvdO family nonheme iron enzyme [Phycisphaerae bacterium]